MAMHMNDIPVMHPPIEQSRTDPDRRQCLVRIAALALAHSASTSAALAAPPAGVRPGTAAIGDDDAFAFGLVGDTSYLPFENAAFDRVLDAMNADTLAYVIHVGDLKSGSSECRDDDLGRRIAQLDRSAHPLVLTPGDNDWTDCHRKAGSSLPRDEVARERLRWLRRTAFGRATSLGHHRLPLDVQSSATPENRRWRVGSLMNCTVHVVGSDDGRGLGRDGPDPDWTARREANLAWIAQTVDQALAADARGLVIALHADMQWPRRREQVDASDDAYGDIRRAIVKAAERFGRPVLLAHGDSHIFTSDTLMPGGGELPNLQRVISYGSPFSQSWVRIAWNPQGVVHSRDPRHAAFVISPRQISS